MKSEILGASRVLDLLANGASTTEIINLQNKRLRERQGGIDRGFFSESNVREALLGLSVVRGVRMVPRRSKQDNRGIDMFVDLHTPQSLVDNIKVQVKSDIKRIEDFKRDLAKARKIKGDINEWLIRHRWIVLNGQLTQDLIRSNFMVQLRRINEYVDSVSDDIALRR